MKILAIFILSLSILSCSKFDSVHFINNFEEIAKTANTIPTLSSRILKIREFGECDSNICPSEILYIAVSEFGEYPEQKLYKTPKADEWSFVNWEHIPQLGEANPTLIINLKSRNKKKVNYYKVKANLKTVIFTEVKR